jgi:DNA-binding XRE family transcriptional regulator
MTPAEFKKARKLMRYDQGQLAEKLEVSRETISRFETGAMPIRRVVSLAMRALLADQVAVAATARGE